MIKRKPKTKKTKKQRKQGKQRDTSHGINAANFVKNENIKVAKNDTN